MHEFSICQALLQQLEELAACHGAHSVRRVTVQVGPLSGIEPSLLSAAFAVARHGGCAQDAELTLESLPLRIRCASCATEAEAAHDQLCCPACGSCCTQLLSGDELLLRRVELVTAPEPATESLTQPEESSAPCARTVAVP
jgi:hydrogenase nickel incorporation protein HypA/HybF